MQIIDGPLCMRGGGKDRPLVAAQDIEPGPDISGVIVPIFERQTEIGTRESCAQLGDKLFLGIADVPETLLLEAAIKPRRMPLT